MKIFYYNTKEADGIITYYFIQLETVILKVRCLSGCNIHEGRVSVMRPDIGYISNLKFIENKDEKLVKELLEKVEPGGGPNVLYLVKNVEYELGRINKEENE